MPDARRLWMVAEPLHALTYFAPESRDAFEAVGLRGFWRGYFAGRAAPLGRSPAELVTATFFGFHPEFVARAIPSIWSVVEPSGAIAARLDGVDHALERVFGRDLPPDEVVAAAGPIRRSLESGRVDGRALFGANQALDWPRAPHLALWHAVTLLREHRGDGHVNALLAAGVDPCEAHVLRIADDALPLDSIQPYRGWNEKDWADATERLRDRSWIDDTGRTTPEGSQVRAEIERDTDRANAVVVDRIEDLDRVLRLLGSIAEVLQAEGEIPYPNPIGVPAPLTPG